jgi:hypothetical protein
MTSKNLLLAAAAVAAAAMAPVAASALTYEGTDYTVAPISAGAGTFSGDTVFEFPVTAAEVATDEFAIFATGSAPFLYKGIDGAAYKFGTSDMSQDVSLTAGATEYFSQVLTATGSWEVFVKFEGGVGGGKYQLGAIPEPATWAMMLLGVAGIGGVMRRRARVASVAA